MALSKEDIKTAYPLPVYNYRIEIGSDAVAFSEVSGLSTSYETTTYKESPVEGGVPGPRVMNMPAQPSATTVTLKKGIVRGASVAALYSWINATQLNQTEKKDIFVRLCDENGDPVISWKVTGSPVSAQVTKRPPTSKARSKAESPDRGSCTCRRSGRRSR